MSEAIHSAVQEATSTLVGGLKALQQQTAKNER